jgi:hypothetical protein
MTRLAKNIEQLVKQRAQQQQTSEYAGPPAPPYLEGGAPQAAPQTQQGVMSPQEFYTQGTTPALDILSALKSQTAPASEALAAERGELMTMAGETMADFYGSDLEFDPQRALQLKVQQHAELMGAQAELQQMEQARQITLKDIATSAGAAYNEYLEAADRDRQIRIAENELKQREIESEVAKKQAAAELEEDVAKRKAATKQVYDETLLTISNHVNEIVKQYNDNLRDGDIPAEEKDIEAKRALDAVESILRPLKSKDRNDIKESAKLRLGISTTTRTKETKEDTWIDRLVKGATRGGRERQKMFKDYLKSQRIGR